MSSETLARKGGSDPSVDHWQCPDCLALNSNDRLDCRECGVVIPEEWDE